jgi:hypothetical protein
VGDFFPAVVLKKELMDGLFSKGMSLQRIKARVEKTWPVYRTHTRTHTQAHTHTHSLLTPNLFLIPIQQMTAASQRPLDQSQTKRRFWKENN